MIDFMLLAKRYSRSSRCHKRQLGAVLVSKDGRVVLGTNGPPKPLDKCKNLYGEELCPRMGLDHGEISGICRAVHAERDCILQVALLGVPTLDSTIYCYMGRPCKDCMLELIAAGVSKIVYLKRDQAYDELSGSIMTEWVAQGGVEEIVEDKWGDF